MKKIFIYLIVVIFSNTQLLAQCPNRIIGIYKTKTDFDIKVLSYSSQSNSGSNNKILLNGLFKSKYLIIKANGIKIKIEKDSVYAFQKSDNSIYRLQNMEVFKILDSTTTLIIYHMNFAQKKTGKINVTRYSYSIGFGGAIKKLSINNLLTDFAFNTAFCNELRTKFKYNTELVEYDECAKTIRVLTIINNLIK
jgi:hypothetical protein